MLSLILKILVAICAGAGSILSLVEPATGAIWWNGLLYFTLQSNIWILFTAVAGIILILKGIPRGRVYSVVQLTFTVSITLTGVVYCTLLAPLLPKPFTLDSVLVHVLSPIFAVIDYLVCARNLKLEYKDNFWGIVPPLYYFAFASVGYVCNWQFAGGLNYPYFFLNWGSPLGAFGLSTQPPFMGVMWYVAVTLILLLLLTRFYIYISRKK